MNKTMKRGHRRRNSPLGTGHLHVSVSREVLQALEHIRQTSDQGETTSHFVDAWLRQHPRIKAIVEQQQEQGKETI